MEEILTPETYITNHNFLSFSRVNRFLKCEAAAAANYYEPSTPAMLIGSYVDAYFSGELEEFKSSHPEIFNSRTGELKSDFKKAEEIIKRIESDEVLLEYLKGEKQKIMTGIIDGIPFKIKMDAYIPKKRIVDLKVMKDFKKVWSDDFRSYINFIKAYNYDIELAIFQEIESQNSGQHLPCFIDGITKEEPSDVGVFQIPQSDLDEAMDSLRNSILPRIKGILSGKIAPERCENCSYCRMTKKAKVLNFELAGLTGDQLREEGIECNDPLIIKEDK